jgi:hypothetical protein
MSHVGCGKERKTVFVSAGLKIATIANMTTIPRIRAEITSKGIFRKLGKKCLGNLL